MAVVLGISGSPRKAGNSETLLGAALEGARRAGAQTELIRLNELTYRGCQNCCGCIPVGHCTIGDDLTAVYEKLRAANVWILSSPIYFDGVSGQLKTFFDRLWCFTHENNKLDGKRAGAIIVTYEAKPTEFYHDAARRLVGYLPWLGDFDAPQVMAEAQLGPADAAAKKPDLLAKARELGERLVRSLALRTP